MKIGRKICHINIGHKELLKILSRLNLKIENLLNMDLNLLINEINTSTIVNDEYGYLMISFNRLDIE